MCKYKPNKYSTDNKIILPKLMPTYDPSLKNQDTQFIFPYTYEILSNIQRKYIPSKLETCLRYHPFNT